MLDFAAIGPVTIYLGDMREVLPALNLRANLLLSDPPYRLTSGGAGDGPGKMKGMFSADRYDNGGELFPMVEWADMAPLFAASMAPDADAIVMTSAREMQAARGALEAAGLQFHNLLVWDKCAATPGPFFMQRCEYGLYMWQGLARPVRNPSAGVIWRGRRGKDSGHPTEKPVEMMWAWIETCSDPGDLVLDPFAGSGSTLVAAAQSGRRAVGIELQRRWFDVACARVEAALAGRWVSDDAPKALPRGALPHRVVP